MRAFKLLDGRDIAIDRRAVGMVVAHQEYPETACVVGLRLAAAKPVPLQATYSDVLAWWIGADTAAGNGAR